MIEALSRFQNEQRSIEYVKLDAAQAGTIDPPSPETLAGYFDDHKAQFRAPEYRKIAFVAITPGRDRQMVRRLRRGRQEAVRAAPRQARHAGKARGVANRVSERGGSRGGAQPHRVRNVVRRSRQGARAQCRPTSTSAWSRNPRSSIRAIADAAFSLPSGEVSQPVQGKFGVALVKIGKIEPGVEPSYESVAARPEEGNRDRTRAQVGRRSARQDGRRARRRRQRRSRPRRNWGSPPSPSTPSTAPAAFPTASWRPTFPRGLDVVSQAFNSDVGVDNDPISFNGGYVWYDVLGITPSRERNLDEVKDQVEARWRDDQITSRLRTKATEMVQKLDQGGKLADEAASCRIEGRNRRRLQARRLPARRARRRGRGGVSHRQGWRRTDRRRRRQRMDRVPRHRHHRAAGRPCLRRHEEAEGDACSAA